MSEKAKRQRIGYIDMTKGIACLIMVMGHQMALAYSHMRLLEWIMLSIIGGFAATSFFFSSGINVFNFQVRNDKKAGFRALRFYLASAAALFLLGYTYSINRMTFLMGSGTWTLFHSIAVGTVVTYLLIRTRLPGWIHMLIALALYLFWAQFWYRAGLPALAEVREITDGGKSFAASVEFSRSLRPFQRMLFMHFSFLPWACYILMGAVTFRSIRGRPETRARWLVFYLILVLVGIASHWVVPQPWVHRCPLDLFLRHMPYLFFGWMGSAGLFIVGCDLWYKGAANMTGQLSKRIWDYMEFLGRESFTFLIWHWMLLMGINTFYQLAFKQSVLGEYPYIMHVPWLTTLALSLLTMPFAVRMGEQWRRRPSAWAELLGLVVGGMVLSIFLLAAGNLPLGIMVSFGPVLGFAYVYPLVRLKLRRRYTIKPRPAKQTPTSA